MKAWTSSSAIITTVARPAAVASVAAAGGMVTSGVAGTVSGERSRLSSPAPSSPGAGAGSGAGIPGAMGSGEMMSGIGFSGRIGCASGAGVSWASTAPAMTVAAIMVSNRFDIMCASSLPSPRLAIPRRSAVAGRPVPASVENAERRRRRCTGRPASSKVRPWAI